MRKTNITLLTFVIIFLLSNTTIVSSADLTGARPLAMGGAFVGVADDANSVLWNPAGMKQFQESYFGANYRVDQYDNKLMGNILVIRSRANNGARYLDWGFGTSKNSEIINSVEYQRTSYVVALADQYTRNIAIGVSGKHITEESNDFGSGNNFTLDAGLLLKFGKIFNIGIVGYNLTDPSLRSFSRKLQGGVAIKLSDFIKLAADGAKMYSDNYSSSDINYNLGVELSLVEAIALRGGYSEEKIYKNRYVSGGVGLTTSNAIIEYTYYNGLNDKVDNRHIFSLTFVFGPAKK
ncbi:MAG: hypothetical protein ACC630_03015 [Nitrospinota bacterium]